MNTCKNEIRPSSITKDRDNISKKTPQRLDHPRNRSNSSINLCFRRLDLLDIFHVILYSNTSKGSTQSLTYSINNNHPKHKTPVHFYRKHFEPIHCSTETRRTPFLGIIFLHNNNIGGFKILILQHNLISKPKYIKQQLLPSWLIKASQTRNLFNQKNAKPTSQIRIFWTGYLESDDFLGILEISDQGFDFFWNQHDSSFPQWRILCKWGSFRSLIHCSEIWIQKGEILGRRACIKFDSVPIIIIFYFLYSLGHQT